MSEHVDGETGEISEEILDPKLRHWDTLSQTDPRHTKPFKRPGGFSGTAIRPIYNQYRLTEHFGPAGVGWGTDKPEFSTIECNDEVLVFCTLRCWYMDEDGKRAELYGVGGDKVLLKAWDRDAKEWRLRTDDEAFKKAFTDALGNAFLRLGVSADVHMGLFEDSKYVSSVLHQLAAEPPAALPQSPPERPAQARSAARAPTAVAKTQKHTPGPVSTNGNGAQIPVGIQQFLDRDNYNIDVRKAGDWPRCASYFETNYLKILTHCDLSAATKLWRDNQDNREGFEKTVKPEVYAAFTLKAEPEPA